MRKFLNFFRRLLKMEQKMNPEVKTKWVNALRSSDYEQGRFALRDSQNCYCCLGVLCDLYAKEKRKEWVKGTWCYYYQSKDACPPISVAKWSDCRSFSKLMRMNDVEGKSFKEIADYIEENL
jgi:hypothetical protein